MISRGISDRLLVITGQMVAAAVAAVAVVAALAAVVQGVLADLLSCGARRALAGLISIFKMQRGS